MKLIKLAAAALNQTPFDWDNNLRNIRNAIEAAKRERVDVLCLPELALSGYSCEDAFFSPGIIGTAWELLLDLVEYSKGIAVSVGVPVLHNKALFNCAAFLVDGELLGVVAKKHLCGEGVYYEPRWFKPWPDDVVQSIECNGVTYPLGDIFFDLSGIRLGFEICEDAWVANRPGAQLAMQGADIILNPSASHFAFGKHAVRRRFILDGSRAFNVAYVYSNLVGCEAGRLIFDGGCHIAAGGNLYAAASRFSFRDMHLTSATVDLDQLRMKQARVTSFEPELESSSQCISSSSSAVFYPHDSPSKPLVEQDQWEESKQLKCEEFARAVSLGLCDYMRKSHSKGFVVSLSGGADSGTVACLVRIMVELGATELGVDTLAGRLGLAIKAPSVSKLMAGILTCVYQRTKNSSETTETAACELATALNATYYRFDVDTLVDDYVQLVTGATPHQLNWESSDLALQNVQARARVPGVWLVANIESKLLLSTSNRSEAAVGYATMDGDTAGGLSPIAGVDKHFVNRWLRWLETEGLNGFSVWPVLSHITKQTPTAELRPPDMSQTDEADLMPYDLLEAIERIAIGQKKLPLQVYKSLHAEWSERFSDEQLVNYIERFFTLWCRNQWKRERYAPAFHLDDKNLDPKTWCRFPILSGGYRKELDELRQALS